MNKSGLTDFRISIIFAVVSLLGFLLIPKLNIRLNPATTGSSIYISYSLQGASPEVIDNKIASVIEEKISLLTGINNIQTYSFVNYGYIKVSLDKYASTDRMRLEIANAVRQIKTLLPAGTSYPQVSLHNPGDDSQTAFLVYQINADTNSTEIKKTLDRLLIPHLSALSQVDKVELNGYVPMEYVIKFDKNLFNNYHLSTKDIVNAVHKYFDRQSLGKISYNGQYISAVILNNKFENWHIPIVKRQGHIIYLDEISQINLQEQTSFSYHRINGKTAVSLSVYPVKSANTIVLRKKIDKIISEQINNFPAGFSLIKTYDSTEYLQNELYKIIKRTLWVIVILLLFVLLISHSIKYFFIIILSLLANLGIAFLLYYFFNIQIHLYSLAGITISFGLVMDNSIVMIDHLKRYRNTKVFLPVMASTFTTIAALSVIFFLNDELKNNLEDFAYVIIINLFVSLLVALWLIPALLRYFSFDIKMKNTNKSRTNAWVKFYEKFLLFSIRYKKLWITFIVLLFGLPVFMLPQKINADNNWAIIYNKTLGNDWYLDNVRPYVDRYLGGSLRLFSQYVFESASYRKNEETKLYVLARLPKGSNLDQMNEVFLLLDNYLSQFSQIKTFQTDVYQSGFAQVEIVFYPQQSAFAYSLKTMLIRKAMDWGGIHWNIYGVGKGFNNAAGTMNNYNFQIESVGYNYEDLNQWIDSLQMALLQHPRIKKINVSSSVYPQKSQYSYYRFKFATDKLALLGLSAYDIWNEVNDFSLHLTPALFITVNGHNQPVRLNSFQSASFDMWKLMNQPINIQNKTLKIKETATVSLQKTPSKIYKENQEYIKYINVQYIGAHKFGKKAIQHKIDSLQNSLPLGIKFNLKEKKYYFSQDSQYYYMIFLVILLIFGISAVFFENLKQALIVNSLIPVSFIGIFLVFYFFDFNFDQGGIAGFILVSGITVNAVYYILNDYNFLRKQHPDKKNYQIYLQAFYHKIFPVFLTIISSILGFIPFISDGQNEVFWFSLAVAAIGGLIFSIIGILLYLPVFTLKMPTK